MVDVDRSSACTRVDLSPAGMIAPSPGASEPDQCHDWLVYAS